MNDYTTVMEQCEKVLAIEPGNTKCQFRMASAIWNNSKTHSESEVKSAFKYISEAKKAMPQEKKFDQVYDEICSAHSALLKEASPAP